MMRGIKFCLFWLAFAAGSVSADSRHLLQLVDYLGVDYPEAVAAGEIINANEYREMQEFAALIAKQIDTLPTSPAKTQLQNLAATLKQGVHERINSEVIRDNTQQMRQLLMQHYQALELPQRPPDFERAQALYESHCAGCHGEQGYGNGPLAASLEPPPTDFYDLERAHQRSLLGLYHTISLGVEGTAMTAFSQLSTDERWSLAFYVGALAAQKNTGQQAPANHALDLTALVSASPAELAARYQRDTQWALQWRQHPQSLFKQQDDAIELAIEKLQSSAALYAQEKQSAAMDAAISAYLDGFELVEAPLQNLAPDLMLQIEQAMLGLRHDIDRQISTAQMQDKVNHLVQLLRQAQAQLKQGALSSGVAFTSAFIILLREGLEAILILAAITAFLIKTERRNLLRAMHTGWLLALMAGFATWFASEYLIDISGAAREVTEGMTALFAAGILFYVGFWMHNNLHAARWNAFIADKIDGALNRRTAWSVTAIAFVAVYREAFEVVLFYQALWAQTAGTGSHSALLGGIGVAILLLVVLSWGIFKLGIKLPLKQFFAASAFIMFTLAIIFAGKGILALQEAGKLPASPLAFPTIKLLGIYPNLQGLLLQMALLLLALTLVMLNRRRSV